MSWSGFKKNVGRATTQVMMKTGHVEKTSDRSYEVEERRYRTLEAASLRLQKEAKGYLDSLRAMTASQMRIAETIDAFYGDSGASDGVSRSYKSAVEDLDAETVKALDGPYRTTVLEPINRFCNYFPDINECIKKRQHKMLDYDALRAKVKKLTEKPDKDPGKLPRTEKETEMVSLQAFLTDDPFNARPPSMDTPPCHRRFDVSELDLAVPSPPKALQRPEIERLRREQAQSPSRHTSAQLAHSSSASSQASQVDAGRLSAESMVPLLQRSSSLATRATTSTISSSDTVIHVGSNPTTTDPTVTPSRTMDSFLFTHQHKHASSRSNLSTPLMEPSELEELMQPFKEEFRQKQADTFAQAKASYEQLNEQLTSELPQLIDLRVPYLDPSFEALVKIQLRFCAEAYSRMAQVQQYLDASTRDQYASGDLDARVEDVLGQIRELSIAGTV